MDKWFNSKWFVRAVSLALAILLYVFVYFEVNTIQSDSRIPSGSNNAIQTLNDVPVDIRIDGDQFVVSGVPEYVSVRLEGPNSVLIPTVRQRNFDVFVNLNGLEEGDHTVELQSAKVPDDLSIYIEPKTIPITIEERATEEFPVLIDYINLDQLPEGYELGEAEVNPETIMITTSKSVMEQIAMVKVFVDVAGLTEPINSREVPVNVYDGQGNGLNVRVNPERVIVSVNVDNPSKTVSVKVDTIGDLPEGYELTSITAIPDEVEVFAVSDVLNTIDELLTESIDLATITQSGTMDVKLVVPDGASVQDDTITIELEIDQSKVFEEVPISIENLGAGQDVIFLDPPIPISRVIIKGPEDEVRKLSEEDINVFINLENLSEGEHVVPVSIEGPGDVSFEVDLEEVTVDITES